MGFGITTIFYLLIGLGVAAAVYLADSQPSRGMAMFRVASALIFWPLYVPILLSGSHSETQPETPAESSDGDAMSQAITQVEAELDLALASLDGWVEDVLAHENDRFHELSAAWRVQAERIREMDRLLARTIPAASGPEANDRWRHSEQSRRANLDRLRHVRDRAFDDLMGTLASVRELVSMIHLAKFTGAPASRAEELVAQIATAIEGISAVTWQDAQRDSTVRPSGPTFHSTTSLEEIVPCDSSAASATSSPPI